MAVTKEIWTYERQLRRDTKSVRWHFVDRWTIDPELAYEDQPYELYFRNEDRTEFGLLRFERRKGQSVPKL